MQFEPLKDIQAVKLSLSDVNHQNDESQIDTVVVDRELRSLIDNMMPLISEIEKAFNASDQAKDVKALVRAIDQAMDKVHVLQDCATITPGSAGEAMSGLSRLANYADNLIDPDFLKTSIN